MVRVNSIGCEGELAFTISDDVSVKVVSKMSEESEKRRERETKEPRVRSMLKPKLSLAFSKIVASLVLGLGSTNSNLNKL